MELISASEIEDYYFEPRHSFMSADSIQNQVKLSLSAQEKTYDFDDFVTAVSKARKGNVDVKKMEISDFYRWKSWKSEAKMKSSPNRIYLKVIFHIKAVRRQLHLLYKTTYEDEEEYKTLDFLQTRILKKGIIPNAIVQSTPAGFPADKRGSFLKK